MNKKMAFREDMIEAIREGQKTQTRRVMKPQPEIDADRMWSWRDCQWMDGGIGFPHSAIEDHAPVQVGDVVSVETPDGTLAGISLKFKRVWVERLHALSTYDISCEGIRSSSAVLARLDFHNLWDSIYEERRYSWAANPWVWGYSFEVLEQRAGSQGGAWIPVVEKLPARDERVLTFTPNRMDSDIGPVSVNWGWVCGSPAHKEITHWMLPPGPPETLT